MTEEEKDVEVKKLLMDYSEEDLKDLRECCLEITESYHLGLCALRLLQLADHELADHHCASSYLFLRAIAKRLQWYHDTVQKMHEAHKLDKVIH